jgi:hypothetical protein
VARVDLSNPSELRVAMAEHEVALASSSSHRPSGRCWQKFLQVGDSKRFDHDHHRPPHAAELTSRELVAETGAPS